MQTYDHKKIEKKWQKVWEKKKLFKAFDPKKAGAKKTAKDSLAKASLPAKKFYALIEFPFPSGDGLHVGHIRSNTGMDIISHKRRREGYDVLYPMGWDAFGLPTENYAIKTGIQPAVVAKTNTDNFRRQLKSLGFSFDWDREINTTDPKYYKWTQWIFLRLLDAGLAYKKRMTINWCPKDLIGLANEEVVDGKCERCGTAVEKREKEQWMLAITKYADRLHKDLDTVDYLEQIKTQQRNWIGRSEGVNFKCKIKDLGITVEMYNSVPQTYCAETFTVIAPEHPLVEKLVKGTSYEKPVLELVAKIKQKKLENKFDIDTDLEGIFTGRYIENYAGLGRDLPIWVASYALADYGSGIVNCSAHDERDYKFVKKYSIPLHEVAEPLAVTVGGDDAFRHDMPVVERNAVVCIVKHWAEDKYLCVSLKGVKWQGFVVGGIEKGEEPSVAGAREIAEETGYISAHFEKILGGTIHAKFYQVAKGQTRFAHFTPALFKLKNGDRREITEEEKNVHESMSWLTATEVDAFLTHEGMKLVWDRVMGRSKPAVKNGILTEPKEFKGREWNEVRNDIIEHLVHKGIATRAVNYKLRDWVFSRQRYWGEPIPVVHCDKCGIVPVPVKDLPLKLPKVKNYKPTETGESPLAAIDSWVNTKCPKCKGKAKRETDTMPNWAGSSWYYLRYTDAKNAKEFAFADKLKFWTPVDWYNGGMEHTTLHLLYSRFWHKFLFDQKLVPTNEPYAKRTSHGLILAKGGEKMSKSKGNVVNPDGIVEAVGADALRLYEMFMGPFDQAIAWDENGIVGTRRFIERVWKLREKVTLDTKKSNDVSAEADKLVHRTIKKVSEDIETMRFNTAVSALMIAVNEMEKMPTISQDHYGIMLQLLAPFAPHVADELWASMGNKKSIHTEPWPVFDPAKIADANITIPVQINGKTRTRFEFPATDIAGMTDAQAEAYVKEKALNLDGIKDKAYSNNIKKVIYVKGRLINFVIG